MTRRSFIQRFIYSILVMFFGPAILEQLDIEATEKLVDDIAEGRRAIPSLFVKNDQLYYRDDRGRVSALTGAGIIPGAGTVVMTPEAQARLGGGIEVA